MDIKCPHCGTEYEVEKKDMYRYTKCSVCGKGFVLGATTSLLSSDSAKTTTTGASVSQTHSVSSRQRANPVPRSRPFAGKMSQVSVPRSRSGTRILWLSIGGVCVVLAIVLAAVFVGKGNWKGENKIIPHTEIAAQPGEESPGNGNAGVPPVTETAVASQNDVAASNEKTDSNVADSVEVKDNDLAISSNASKENEEKSDDGEERSVPESGEEEVVVANVKVVPAETIATSNVIRGRNPLDMFRFGDKPKQALVETDGHRTLQYKVEGFLGIQRMTLAYTKKDSLFSISFVSENDHYSAAESDIRVSKFMQLCDEWYDGIKWGIGKQEHDGRKFAIGRIKNTCETREIARENGKSKLGKVYNYQDMVFSIMPTRGERNVVGLQVNLSDNRRRRLETDYLMLDVRRPLQISDAQYNNAREWLRKQLSDHHLGECQITRRYDRDMLYNYDYSFERRLIDDERRASISLESGVLEIWGEIPIDESYAEQLIRAKIIVMNKVFAGIAGEIYDYRPLGPRASITLPCPLCHGDKSKTDTCRECWSKKSKRNSGQVSIDKPDFKHKFEAYKTYYRTRMEPSGWRDKPKQSTPKVKPLHKEYVPTKQEQRDIDDVLRKGREATREYNRRRRR